MYGSIARLRALEGTGDGLLELVEPLKAGIAQAGPTDLYLFRLDESSDEWILVVASYATKGAYRDTMAALTQIAAYGALLAALDQPPQWDYGEVVSRDELAYSGL